MTDKQNTETTPDTSLAAFYDMLARHDWTYGYSDDGGAVRRGEASEKAIRMVSLQSERHSRLYQEYERHIFLGLPKPAKPE